MANPRTPSPAPGAWDVSTPTPGVQPQYVMSKKERLNEISKLRDDIAFIDKKIVKLQKWIAACKKLNQFNDGNLLSRLTGVSYSSLSSDALNDSYIWLSDKDKNYMNSGKITKDFSPDLNVRVYSPEEAIAHDKFLVTLNPRGVNYIMNSLFEWATSAGKAMHLFSKTYLQSILLYYITTKKSTQVDVNNKTNDYTKLYKTAPPTNNSNNSNNSNDTKSADTTTPTVTYVDIRSKQTLYNAPSVKESYYPSNLFKAIKPNDSAKLTPEEQVPLFNGNIPSKVVDAKQLWESALGSKGMFQVNTQMPENTNYTSKNIDSTKPDITLSYDKYGFQFLYNPSTIEMAYMGIAQTDMSMYTSGREAFNLVPPTNTSATVSFDILINRMNDMKYYTPAGTLTAKGKTAYPQDHVPNAKEQKQIYNMGTMYDVEYLLKTLLGYTMKSYLRNNMETADMGWFSKRPVELHLGKNLRYLGYVGGVSLRHAIFDERMVPLFTTVHIEFSRIPDYSNVDTSNNKTGSGLGGLTAL